jgi:hypothetical protein
MPELEHAGRDELSRDVFLLFTSTLQDLERIEVPSQPFVLFLGADTTEAVPEPLFNVARVLLDAGAVYVLCCGRGCERAEDLFDEAVAGELGEEAYGSVMTTSHSSESILEALEFATSVAVPDEAFAANCSTVVVAFVGNVNWYNEAQNYLEDLLTGGK